MKTLGFAGLGHWLACSLRNKTDGGWGAIQSFKKRPYGKCLDNDTPLPITENPMHRTLVIYSTAQAGKFVIGGTDLDGLKNCANWYVGLCESWGPGGLWGTG